MTDYQQEQFPLPTPGRLRRELRLGRPPWWMVVGLIVVIVATWIPLYLIGKKRSSFSTLPKIHYIQDMDNQPAFRAQHPSSLFADGSAARPIISGTMARGHLRLDDDYWRGYRTISGETENRIEFVSEFPAQVTVDARLIQRGEERFGIYCVVCHGKIGVGDGIVHQRALAANEAQWVPPTNLLTQLARDRKEGQLFQAISDGVRNMPGYNTQISVDDRWAIVAWLRELQKSQPVAPPAEVSPSQ